MVEWNGQRDVVGLGRPGRRFPRRRWREAGARRARDEAATSGDGGDGEGSGRNRIWRGGGNLGRKKAGCGR